MQPTAGLQMGRQVRSRTRSEPENELKLKPGPKNPENLFKSTKVCGYCSELSNSFQLILTK